MTSARVGLLVVILVQPAILAAAAAPVVVSQIHRAFSTREVHVKRGESVRFENADEFFHHVYVQSPTFSFSSNEQAPGTAVEIRFPTAGRFDVRCEIHPRMLLNVSVD